MKKHLIHYTLIFSLIVVSSVFSFAQKVDTSTTKSFSEYSLLPGLSPFQYVNPDTSLANVNIYNPIYRNAYGILNSGNLGGASKDPVMQNQHVGYFSDGFSQFDPYLINPIAKKIIVGSSRYSNVDFHIGSKKQNHIFLKHQQTVKPWLIFGLDYGGMASPGDYSRQINSIRNFDLFTLYSSPSNIYRVYVSFTSNKVNNQESGGISNDTVFEKASGLDTRTLPVHLRSASIQQRSRDYFLKQDLNISRLFHKDSTAKKFDENSLVFSNTLWWKRKYVLFQSNASDSTYFNNTFLDTVVTYDSTFYNTLYANFILQYSPSVVKGLMIAGGFETETLNYYSNGTDHTNSYLNDQVVLGATYHSSLLYLDSWFKKSVVNNNSTGGFEYSANGKYYLNNAGDNAFLNFEFSSKPPVIRDLLYVSNHFIWNNPFENIKAAIIHGGISLSKYSTVLKNETGIYKNLVFYHSDYLPQVYSEQIVVSSFRVVNTLKFGKFGTHENVCYSITGNENIIRVPDIAINGGVFYENFFFKRALQLRSGIDCWYKSSSYADGYMPATGVFYLQDEKKLGNNFTFDWYLNFKIGSAAIFVKLENFLAGTGERNYYGAYQYPEQGRAFKFGINWTLTD